MVVEPLNQPISEKIWASQLGNHFPWDENDKKKKKPPGGGC